MKPLYISSFLIMLSISFLLCFTIERDDSDNDTLVFDIEGSFLSKDSIFLEALNKSKAIFEKTRISKGIISVAFFDVYNDDYSISEEELKNDYNSIHIVNHLRSEVSDIRYLDVVPHKLWDGCNIQYLGNYKYNINYENIICNKSKLTHNKISIEQLINNNTPIVDSILTAIYNNMNFKYKTELFDQYTKSLLMSLYNLDYLNLQEKNKFNGAYDWYLLLKTIKSLNLEENLLEMSGTFSIRGDLKHLGVQNLYQRSYYIWGHFSPIFNIKAKDSKNNLILPTLAVFTDLDPIFVEAKWILKFLEDTYDKNFMQHLDEYLLNDELQYHMLTDFIEFKYGHDVSIFSLYDKYVAYLQEFCEQNK